MMDDGEHIEREKELKREHKFLRNVMATIPDSMLILDRELRIKSANHSFYKLFQTGRVKIIGRDIADILGDNNGKLSAELARLFGTEDMLENFELRYQSEKLGERILNIMARGMIVAEEEEEEEEEELLLVVIQDITERRRAQEALRRAEENFRRSIDDSPLGIRIVSAEGETLYANRAMLDMYGYASIEELETTPRKKRYTPESYAEHQVRKEKRQRGEYVSSQYEISIVRKGGEIRHLDVSRKEVLWDGKTQFQMLYHDVTERKRAEEEVKQVKDRLQLQVERMPIGLIVWDTKFRVRSWNPATENIFGFTAKEALGKHPYDLIVPKAVQPHVDQVWGQLLEGDMTAHSINENTTKDGRTIICEWANTPLKESDGRVIGVLSMVQDITERKQAEAKIARQNAIMAAINRVFGEVVAGESEEQLASTCLTAAQDLTGSEFGFICKVNQAGRLDPIAISDTGWAACKGPGARELLLANDLEARGIRGKVIKEKKSFIFNDPRSQPDWIEPSEGHPQVISFLGVPLEHEGRIWGMIALANKKGGYDQADQEAAEALAPAIMEALMRQRAENALRESEAGYRALVSLGGQVGEAIVMLQDQGGREGVHVFCNDVWPRITGYSEGELLNMSFFELVHPKDSEASLERHRRKIRGESMPGLFEMSIIRKEGTEVPIELTSAYTTYKEKRANVAYIRDITERKRMEEQIRASLKEKEVLLAEVHHRVKNNLQVIASLLSLQSGRTTDQRALELFKAARERVRAMAFVHEQLYRSPDLARIDFGKYVREIAEHLIRSYATVPGAITLQIDVEDFSLDANTAIPCGLIINELVTNSLKYAFPEGSKGKIRISLSPQENKEFLLIVGDNGIGLPQDFDSRTTHSLGMQLVANLVRQLRGSIDLDRQRGTEWRIRFTPLAQFSERSSCYGKATNTGG